ncbi:MAG TPA: PH domain-containing protein [Jiangellaceae bacterium]|nr:PH domain-containing protein [Jiangellaceae bacterium]
MRFPERHLSEDEVVEYHLRTHVKALIAPAVVLLVIAAGLGLGLGFLPDTGAGAQIGRWVLIGAAALAFVIWVVWPLLSWLTSTYTVTTERLITRWGVLTRTGRDLPLSRINDVAYEQSLLDRVLRCGTLVVSAASEQGQVFLHDVPGVHEVQLRLSELVREAHENDGSW